MRAACLLAFGFGLLSATPAFADSHASGAGPAAEAPRPFAFALEAQPLVVETANGPRRFDLEIADEPAERGAGLMHRTDFPRDRALLFDFGAPRDVGMWMRNTPLPLDMIFADETGVVTRIARLTTPGSDAIVSSGGPAAYVVEINAGEADAQGIAPGDRLVHPRIGAAK